MERSIYKELSLWKNRPGRKPLILSGARQVGKTWVMKKFAQQEFENYIYLNFENNNRLKNIFSEVIDVSKIILSLEIESGQKIDANNTLLIFDEVQEVPESLTLMSCFSEEAPQYHILAACSYHGIAMHHKISFPLDKFDFLEILPLSYIEFLKALNENHLANLLENLNWKEIEIYHSKYLYFLRQYFIIGGMPQVVMRFKETNDYAEVRNVQNKILTACEQFFFKQAPARQLSSINKVWRAIPKQLFGENKKFKFSLIKQGARLTNFEQPLSWLVDTGLAMKVCRVKKPNIPLMAYEDTAAFKLYAIDIGLMAAMMNIDIKILLDGNDIFEIHNNALTEQYVVQQMKASKDIKICYWASENSNLAIDFLLQYQTMIVPLEVKAKENLQSKCLKSYFLKFKPLTCFRCSNADYRFNGWFCNVPLYAVGNLSQILADKVKSALIE